MDKESKGFIKLDRNIFDHWIFQDAEKFRAFVDLIQLARWKDEKLLIGNDVVTVPRGSYYTSELKLAERWSWSRKKTREFLKLLENEKMIIKKGTTKGTMLTIENYRLYQDEGTTKSTTKEHQRNNEGYNKGTSKEHQKNNEGYTKEEIKEIKEIKEGEEREEGKEEVPVLPSLSFQTEAHKKIYEEISEVSYRTFFIDTNITETDNEITIKVNNDFHREVIRDRFKDKLYYIFFKKITVI
ncbi:hypothetical protein ACQPUZ_04655 [Clostridium tertium]